MTTANQSAAERNITLVSVANIQPSNYNLVTVCVCNRTHGDRLQYALLLDAFRKFVQTCFIETLARIVVTRLNV